MAYRYCQVLAGYRSKRECNFSYKLEPARGIVLARGHIMRRFGAFKAVATDLEFKASNGFSTFN